MSAADTSIECLRRGNCLPVGGYSVVAAVGESEVDMRREDGVDGVAASGSSGIVGIVGIVGIGIVGIVGIVGGDEDRDRDRSSASRRGFVLVSSRLDASGLFHDATFGANAAMSGLVVMLAAAEAYADATRRAANSDVVRANPAKPVVFAAFAAEAWGYAGSRRFAAELADDETANEEEPSSATSSPLPTWMRGASVDASIELGQVGFARRRIPSAETRPKAFAHVNSASGAAEDALVAALRLGADGRDLDVRRATGAPNPDGGGFLLPPSSLFSLVRRTPRVPGWSSPNTTARSSIRSTAARSTSDSPPWTSIEWHVSPRRSRRRSRESRGKAGTARRGGATNGGERRAREKISRRRSSRPWCPTTRFATPSNV